MSKRVESLKLTDTLIGQFFHTYNADGEVKNQGYVLSSPEPGYYLCQLFEWLVGSPSCRNLAHITDMADWSFWSCSEDMGSAYENKMSHPSPLRKPTIDEHAIERSRRVVEEIRKRAEGVE